MKFVFPCQGENLKRMKSEVEGITDYKYVDVVYEIVGGNIFKQVDPTHVFKPVFWPHQCLCCSACAAWRQTEGCWWLGLQEAQYPRLKPIYHLLRVGASLKFLFMVLKPVLIPPKFVLGFSVVGVRSGAEMARNPELTVEMLAKLNSWCSQGMLKPKVTVFTPERVKEAYSRLHARKAVGKIAVVWAKHKANL